MVSVKMRTLSARSIGSICILLAISHSLRQTVIDVVASNVPRETMEHNSFPFQQEMEERNMHLSLRQQQKFYMKKDQISEIFPLKMLYSFDSIKWHSLIINNRFAYRHIFKNGGTTVEKQTGSRHVEKKEVGERILVATLRDPIDRFLSGWAECGERNKNYMEYEKTDDKDYDGRIQLWLNRTKSLAFNKSSCRRSEQCMCGFHSLPQANFMLTGKKIIDPKIGLVGDLHELSDVLALTGFQYDYSISTSRNATTSSLKNKYFPIKKHLITDDTMRGICEFLRLDYYLFDFELPEPCRT
jgi:hypothetical protein